MIVTVTATTCADPARFAFIIRNEILSARPEAVVNVRPIAAPDARRFQTIETDAEGSFLRELLPDVLDAIRDELNTGEPGYLHS